MRWWVVLALTACGFPPPPDPQQCLGSSFVEVFSKAEPADDLTLTGSLDTDTFATCQDFPSQMDNLACLIVGRSIRIEQLRPTGTRPLILASSTMIVMGVNSSLDVASHGTQIGAGGDSAACIAGQPPSDVSSSGGGSGGSFGGKGGDGSDGGRPGADGGIAAVQAQAAPALRGGCPGGDGLGGGAGRGGHGGGAVFLIAKESIAVDGVINASGSGGTGAAAGDNSSGGGGGSGGMICLDAPMVSVGTGTVFANGGGGGEGGGTNLAGLPGGESTAPAVPASGGAGGAGGGDGGAGSAANTLDGSPGQTPLNDDGGGGGGGGAGQIWIFAGNLQGENIAPPPKSR